MSGASAVLATECGAENSENESSDGSSSESDDNESDANECDNAEDDNESDNECDNAEDGDSNDDNEDESEDEVDKQDIADLSSDDGSEVCPVCLNKFVGQELGSPENCNHTFCFQCISEWSKNVNTCPIDRNEFSYILMKLEASGNVLKRIKVKVNSKQPEDVLPEDTTTCEVCNRGDREDRLLLCDACDLAYHCECLDPPLKRIPINEWHCPPCATILNKKPKNSATSRRVIPRTIVSETVRLRIQRLREHGDEDEFQEPRPTSSNTTSVRRKTSVARPTKRKVVRRRRRRKVSRKSVVLARTKKSTLFNGKTKVRINTKTTTKYRRRRKRRKYYKKRKTSGKTLRTKRSLLASKPLAAPSTKQRIADRLGLYSPPAGHTIPYVKQSGAASGSSAGENLQLFGNKYQLMDFEEDFTAENSKVNRASIMKSNPGPSKCATTSFDVLGSIMGEQNLLHHHSKDITICKDGSLKLKEIETRKKSEVKIGSAVADSKRHPLGLRKPDKTCVKEENDTSSQKSKNISIKKEGIVTPSENTTQVKRKISKQENDVYKHRLNSSSSNGPTKHAERERTHIPATLKKAVHSLARDKGQTKMKKEVTSEFEKQSMVKHTNFENVANSCNLNRNKSTENILNSLIGRYFSNIKKENPSSDDFCKRLTCRTSPQYENMDELMGHSSQRESSCTADIKVEKFSSMVNTNFSSFNNAANLCQNSCAESVKAEMVQPDVGETGDLIKDVKALEKLSKNNFLTCHSMPSLSSGHTEHEIKVKTEPEEGMTSEFNTGCVRPKNVTVYPNGLLDETPILIKKEKKWDMACTLQQSSTTTIKSEPQNSDDEDEISMVFDSYISKKEKVPRKINGKNINIIELGSDSDSENDKAAIKSELSCTANGTESESTGQTREQHYTGIKSIKDGTIMPNATKIKCENSTSSLASCSELTVTTPQSFMNSLRNSYEETRLSPIKDAKIKVEKHSPVASPKCDAAVSSWLDSNLTNVSVKSEITSQEEDNFYNEKTNCTNGNADRRCVNPNIKSEKLEIDKKSNDHSFDDCVSKNRQNAYLTSASASVEALRNKRLQFFSKNGDVVDLAGTLNKKLIPHIKSEKIFESISCSMPNTSAEMLVSTAGQRKRPDQEIQEAAFNNCSLENKNQPQEKIGNIVDPSMPQSFFQNKPLFPTEHVKVKTENNLSVPSSCCNSSTPSSLHLNINHMSVKSEIASPQDNFFNTPDTDCLETNMNRTLTNTIPDGNSSGSSIVDAIVAKTNVQTELLDELPDFNVSFDVSFDKPDFTPEHHTNSMSSADSCESPRNGSCQDSALIPNMFNSNIQHSTIQASNALENDIGEKITHNQHKSSSNKWPGTTERKRRISKPENDYEMFHRFDNSELSSKKQCLPKNSMKSSSLCDIKIRGPSNVCKNTTSNSLDVEKPYHLPKTNVNKSSFTNDSSTSFKNEDPVILNLKQEKLSLSYEPDCKNNSSDLKPANVISQPLCSFEVKEELPNFGFANIKTENDSPVNSSVNNHSSNAFLCSNGISMKSESVPLANCSSNIGQIETGLASVKSENLSITDYSNCSYDKYSSSCGMAPEIKIKIEAPPITIIKMEVAPEVIIKTNTSEGDRKRGLKDCVTKLALTHKGKEKSNGCIIDLFSVNPVHKKRQKVQSLSAENHHPMTILKQKSKDSKSSDIKIEKSLENFKIKLKEDKPVDLKTKIEKEVKKALWPFYQTALINKKVYYDIQEKCVNKVLQNCNNSFNPEKIKKLVHAYVMKMS